VLSGGMKEQLAVLTRLAFAELLLGQGGRPPLSSMTLWRFPAMSAASGDSCFDEIPDLDCHRQDRLELAGQSGCLDQVQQPTTGQVAIGRTKRPIEVELLFHPC